MPSKISGGLMLLDTLKDGQLHLEVDGVPMAIGKSGDSKCVYAFVEGLEFGFTRDGNHLFIDNHSNRKRTLKVTRGYQYFAPTLNPGTHYIEARPWISPPAQDMPSEASEPAPDRE